MNDDTYGLPEGYEANPAITFDQDGDNYWDAARLSASRAYQAAAYEWAIRLVREHGCRSVADVGCGAGTKLAHLHRALPDVVTCGFDQPNAIEFARSYHDFGEWHALDLEAPNLVSASTFDMVITSDVIEHLGNPDRLLEVLRQLTHEGSLVLLTTPERVRLRGADCLSSPNKYHVREWSMPELGHYLSARGWRVLEHRNLNAYAVAQPYFLRRALKRWLRAKTLKYNQAVLMRPPGAVG